MRVEKVQPAGRGNGRFNPDCSRKQNAEFRVQRFWQEFPVLQGRQENEYFGLALCFCIHSHKK